MKQLDFLGVGSAAGRLRTVALTCCGILALGGCASLLGIDDFTDETGGNGASGPGGNGSGAGGNGVGGASTTQTATSTSTGTGGEGGAPPVIDCNLTGAPVQFTSGALRHRRHMDAYHVPGTNRIVTAVGGDLQANVARVRILSRSGNDGSGDELVYSVNNEGEAEVVAVRIEGPRVFVTVRTRFALRVLDVGLTIASGEISGPINVTDIPNPPCTDFEALLVRRPLGPSPRYVVRCSGVGGFPRLSQFQAGAWTNFFDALAPTPQANLRSYIEAGAGEVLLTGDDPGDGSHVFTTPFSAPPRELVLETAPNRVTTNFSAFTEPGGKARLYVATLHDQNVSPARLFTADIGVVDFPGLSQTPPAGFTQLLELTQLDDFVLWGPWIHAGNLILAPGLSIGETEVSLTMTSLTGNVLLQNFPVASLNPLVSEAVGAVKLDLANYGVLWLEGDGNTASLKLQRLACIAN